MYIWYLFLYICICKYRCAYVCVRLPIRPSTGWCICRTADSPQKKTTASGHPSNRRARVLWLSTNAVQVFCRLRSALFRYSFAFLSSNGRISAVPLLLVNVFFVPPSVPFFRSPAIIDAFGTLGSKTKDNVFRWGFQYFVWSVFLVCMKVSIQSSSSPNPPSPP